MLQRDSASTGCIIMDGDVRIRKIVDAMSHLFDVPIYFVHSKYHFLYLINF